MKLDYKLEKEGRMVVLLVGEEESGVRGRDGRVHITPSLTPHNPHQPYTPPISLYEKKKIINKRFKPQETAGRSW